MNAAALKKVAEQGQTLRDEAHTAAALSVREMTVSYGGKPAVFSVDAAFPMGSMAAIVGPNRGPHAADGMCVRMHEPHVSRIHPCCRGVRMSDMQIGCRLWFY